MDEGLVWPPRKEDLERMYLVEKLSAAKISRVYALNRKNPKSAESTVLYQLKKNGIVRRDAAEHVRKVTPTMVDDWVRRYQAGESLKAIARGEVSPVTVYSYLLKMKVPLRDKVEAQIKAVRKYEQRPFQGSDFDKAYLLGFARGDLYVTAHGRSVRVKTSTTHPLMTGLFRSLFSPYGHVHEYPRKSSLSGYEWNLECDLNPSFRLLLDGKSLTGWVMSDRNRLLAYLAGFFDAEGSLYFHRKKKWGAFEVSIANKDEDLLKNIAALLKADGYSPTVTRNRQGSGRGVGGESDHIWRLTMWRYADVRRIIQELSLRHPEKIKKAALALRLDFRASLQDRQQIASEWDELISSIKQGTQAYVEKARIMLDSAESTQIGLSGPLRPASNSFPKR